MQYYEDPIDPATRFARRLQLIGGLIRWTFAAPRRQLKLTDAAHFGVMDYLIDAGLLERVMTRNGVLHVRPVLRRDVVRDPERHHPRTLQGDVNKVIAVAGQGGLILVRNRGLITESLHELEAAGCSRVVDPINVLTLTGFLQPELLDEGVTMLAVASERTSTSTKKGGGL